MNMNTDNMSMMKKAHRNVINSLASNIEDDGRLVKLAGIANDLLREEKAEKGEYCEAAQIFDFSEANSTGSRGIVTK